LKSPADVCGKASLRFVQISFFGEIGKLSERGDGAVETFGKEFEIGQTGVFHGMYPLFL
jgi:hypothetical protein